MDRICFICGRMDEEVKKLFTFPVNMNKQRLWNESLGIPENNTYSKRMRICNHHFAKECFMLNKFPLTLKRDAKPLRIIFNEENLITNEVPMQPELDQTNLTDSVMEKNLITSEVPTQPELDQTNLTDSVMEKNLITSEVPTQPELDKANLTNSVMDVETDKRKNEGVMCSAKNCHNKRCISKESFFRFPKDLMRATTWAIACGNEDLLINIEALYNGYRLCGAHFEPKMFRNDLKNRLHSNAVPTIFPSLENSSIISEHNYSLLTFKTCPGNSNEIMLENKESIDSIIGNKSPQKNDNQDYQVKCSSTQTSTEFEFHSPETDKLRKTIKMQRNQINQLKNENKKLLEQLKLFREKHY